MNRPGEDTLIRYFRGECLPDEAAAVRLYLAAGVDGDYIQQCLREAWGDLSTAPPAPMNDAQLQAAWEKLGVHTAAIVPMKQRSRKWLRYAAVATILLGAATASWLVGVRMMQPREVVIAWQEYTAPKGNARQLKLADGSVVTLFPGSTLRLPDNYNGKDRSVKLKGRAFFEVAQHAGKPFSVNTGALTTKVLGTAFEVNNDSKITLLNGKVAVSFRSRELATLSPGQQVVFDTTLQTWQVSEVNAKDAAAWVYGEFVYDRAPLQQVLHDIANWYDVQIHVNASSITGKEITTNFRRLPLEQVMKMISKASGLRYRLQNGQVYLEPASK
jgi:transmembrane sensor